MQAEPSNQMSDDFAFGERIINYVRWPLIGVLFLFNNFGFTENRSFIWPINGMLLAALCMTAYIQYRLRRGHSFGKRVTLALAMLQDGLITAGVYLTGLYDSHFFIFYYPSLLGFSLAFSLRTSIVYVSVLGLGYSALCWFFTPGVSGDLTAIKVLIERWIVMYIIVIIGSYLVRQERKRRLEAIDSERRMARENELLLQSLNRQMENWHLIAQANDRTAEQLAALARELVNLADELGAGSEEIATTTREMTDRAMTHVDQVSALGRITEKVVSAAHDLSTSATPTGTASKQAQRAVLNATEAVEALNRRSQAIGDLAATVRRVADQTNLLAFNAAIEAIQAGQKGQRFAVVAREVRQVAERAIGLAREIDELSAEVQQGARQVLNAMSEIAEMVNQTVGLVQVTTQASESQHSSADVMSQSVSTLERVSRQNATDIQSVATTVEQQQGALRQIMTLSQNLAESAGNLRSLAETIGG